MNFTSDNAAPAHPAILHALARANEGFAASYGADAIMDRVTMRIREIFEAPAAAVHLVATGTAANALALACLCPPWATIFCHREAHIEEDEGGAPEFFTAGAKLTLVDGPDARIDPEALDAAMAHANRLGVHNIQRGALSLTNVTEAGAVYTPDEVARLAGVAKRWGVPVHMDGARFANALAATGASPAEMTWKAGVDALSFGGTKNGLMGVEAVILFDPDRSWEFQLRRKRGGHLFSKHRYLSAQMDAYLADGLWMALARASNARAAELADGLTAAGARLLHPADANMIFAEWPRAGHRALREAGAKYHFQPADHSMDGPADHPLAARLVCSWCTTEAEVADFLATLGAVGAAPA
jgi:threonine aldolase